jgi:bacteriorhodopsin
MNVLHRVDPPWTAVLSEGQHTLVLFATVAVVLAFLATLVRVRFASAEVHGEFRTASLTANAVVAIALGSYVLILASLVLGYRHTAEGWIPTATAQYAWAVRYADWAVTVPLLVVELLAVSLARSTAQKELTRRVGMGLAFLMIVLGFLGAFVVGDGRDFGALVLFGGLSAICFLGLTILIVRVALHSLPRIVRSARAPYRSAVVLLLVVWFAYPLVYGLQGTTAGGGWAVVGVVVLSAADVVAKVGFSSLIHRTAVFQSRAEEDASPTTERRPRLPEADSLWVEHQSRYERDLDSRSE